MDRNEVKQVITAWYSENLEELDQDALKEWLDDNYPCPHDNTERTDCGYCNGSGEGSTPDTMCSFCNGSGVGDGMVCFDCGEYLS